MNDITLDQNDEELLTYEVSDEALEGRPARKKHTRSLSGSALPSIFAQVLDARPNGSAAL
jgi:hypothetical protein